MNKSFKFAVCLLTIVLAAGAITCMAAENPKTAQAGPAVGNAPQNAPLGLIFNRKLVSTSQSWDCCSAVAIDPGFVALDNPVNFTCPKGGTCTVSAEQNVQVSGSTSANRFAICTEVDGNIIQEPSCPYLGTVPSDGSYIAGSFVQNMSAVPSGNHTLQTFVYTDNGGDRAIFNITYRLYRP